MEVGITTRGSSSEVAWSVGACSSHTDNDGKNEYTDHAHFTQQCCLAAGNHKITCKDSYGDGWHGGYLEINGVKYCEDFTNGNEKQANLTFPPPSIGKELKY